MRSSPDSYQLAKAKRRWLPSAAQLHDGMQQHALDGRREDLRHAPELGMDESSINITQLDVDRGALVRHPLDRGVMHVWRTDIPEERIRHERKVS